MKIREVVQAALLYLGEEAGQVDEIGLRDGKIDLMLKCVNLTRKEIAAEYAPLIETQTVTLENGNFGYDALQQRVLEILSVKNAAGTEVGFRQRVAACHTETTGEATITYRYLPCDGELDDDCALPIAVTAQIAALGACAEYCMIEGRYEQAATFSQRYQSALRAALRANRAMKLPSRRWK